MVLIFFFAKPITLGYPEKLKSAFFLGKEFSKERQFVDDLHIISFTEFTIFETMTHDAFYTVLANGGKWNGTDPFIEKEK